MARSFVSFADKNNSLYPTVTFFGHFEMVAQIAWSAISVNICGLHVNIEKK